MKALVIGCGELGSRHAQALGRHSKVDKLTLVDPSPRSLKVSLDRVRESGFRGEVDLHQNVSEIEGHQGLVVLATSSNERASALQEFQQFGTADLVLLEKLLAPNNTALQKLEELVSIRNERYWVNCPMPYYQHYDFIAQNLRLETPVSPVKYRVTSSNFGLVTNAIHYLDHFEKVTNRIVSAVSLDPGPQVIQSKRKGYSELLGTIRAETEFGDELVISFSDTGALETLQIQISTNDTTWIVDELSMEMTEIRRGVLKRKATFSTPRQSETTHLALMRLESEEPPMWATVESSLRLHRQLFEALYGRREVNSGIFFT